MISEYKKTMEQFAPKQRKNKNHGGGNKPQQRRHYNPQHNPNYSLMQNQQQLRGATPRFSYSPFLTYSQPGQKVNSNVGSAPKKKNLDEQELLCPKCTRYYQVIQQEQPIEATRQTKIQPLIPAGFNLRGPAFSSLPPPQQSQPSQHLLRLPYVLPCDHTICGDCIRLAHAQRAVKCPECDVCAAIDVEREPDKSFAINYYLVGRIYLLRYQTVSSSSNMSNFQPAGPGGDPFSRFVRANASAVQQQNQPFNYNQPPPGYTSMQMPGGMPPFGGGDPNRIDLNFMTVDSASTSLAQKCSMGHCKSPAAFYCQECKSIFCTSCSKVLHGGEIAGLKDHRIRPLQPQLLAACPQHSASVLDFHCVNCDVDVCCYCFIEDGHAGHEHIRLTVLSEDQKTGFKELIVNVEGKLRKLENTYKVAEQHIHASMDQTNLAAGDNKQHQQVVANVNKHFADLMAKLLNTHHRLRQKLDMAQHASVASLRAIQSEVAQRLATGGSLLSQGRLVLDTAESKKAVATIFNVSMLKLELEQMLEWPSCLVDGREGDDKTAGNIEFISDLSENLDKFCALKVRDADQFQLVHEDSIPDGFAVAKQPEIVQHDFPDTSSQSSYRSNVSSMASTSRQSEFNRPSRPPSALSVSKMPPARQITNSITIPNIGGRYPVTVVHINNPESIFIQLLENLPILKSIHNDLANYVKSLTATEVHDPQMGECYIVKQNIHWARARCIKPSSRKAELYVVQLLETGQVIEVSQLHMRECNAQFRQIPPMSYQCRLNNLYPIDKYWPADAKNLLENILAVKNGYISPFVPKHKVGGMESCNVTMQVFGRENGIYNVQLIASREDTSTMLSHALLFTGLAKPIDSSNEETDIKTVETNKIYENTSKMEVNQRTRVTMVHVEDPCNIYVHLYNFLSHIKDLLRNMNVYYLENNRGIIYTPKIGMNVSIQYAENQSYNWYRGRVIDVIYGTGKVVVLLIDFGKIVTVDYKNLRTLPQNFTVLECQAVHIRLADIEAPDSSPSGSTAAWPEATMEFLREFIKYSGHHLEIAVIEGGNTEAQEKGHLVLLFECLPMIHYCINAQLVEAGLAKSTGQFSSCDNISWPQGGTSLDGNSSDDARTLHRQAGKHHQSSGAAHNTHKSLIRMIEGTPSFTLDLLNTIQGAEAKQIEQEDDDDDDDESIAEGMGRMEVDVLLVKSPDEIYIKVKSRDPQVAQIEPDLVRRLQLHYGGGAAASERDDFENAWQKGDNIVAYNYHTAQFHRGVLLEISTDVKEQYTVLCRDRAIEFKTEYSSIYPLAAEFEETPYLSKRIRLANIQPLLQNKWSLFASDLIRNMCNLGNSDSLNSGTANPKYYYRKTGNAHDMGDGGEKAQPGILWVCTLISCGPLERSRYQYRSVNKKLIRSGVAVSDKTNHPNIVRRQPQVVNPPATAQQPKEQMQNIRNTPVLTPSHTANAVMRAFAESTAADDVLFSPIADPDEEDSGAATSESDMGSRRRKKATSSTDSATSTSNSSKSSKKKAEEPIVKQPRITSYLPSIPLPERRFIADATFLDETAHIYLYPQQLEPVITTLSTSIQAAVKMYNQKILVANPSKKAKSYKIGELCTVQYHRDRKWYRGKITHVIPCNTAGSSGFEYRVQMVDYGNVEQVKLAELCDLVLCPTVPLITTRIRMHQVEPKVGPWNTSILDVIHSLVVDKTIHVLLCDKMLASQTVPNAIITREDGANINDYLVQEFDCLCRGKEIDAPKDDSDDDVVILEESESPEITPLEESSQPVFNFEELELMPRLKVGDKRIVKVVDIIEINVVAVKLLPENMQHLEKTYDEIFASFQDPKIEHLPLKEMRTGVVCLARFSADCQYYRAEILGVIPPKPRPTASDEIAAPESAHVFFIDYGNREVVARCHLRSISPYDPKARQLPSLVRMVALHSIRLPPKSPDHMQDAAMNQLTELLQQRKVTMEVVRNEPKVSVNLLDPQTSQLVYESLITQGLIVYADNDESDNSDIEYQEYK